MAIYHLHCDIIGRSKGRSAVAAAAYRATCKIEDRTTGETFDYSRKEKALYEHIYSRAKTKNGVKIAQVPDWARNRSELWNRVEEKENRKNSQFCRSFDIALMKELSFEDNKKLVEKWVNRNFCSRGLVADVVIHAPHKNADGKSNENLHTHILIPTRKIDLNGWGEKDREANSIDFLQKIRKSWADLVNEKFKELGMSERIDERTLEEQGIDREPQQHQGVSATAIERKGETARRRKYKSQELPAELKIEKVSEEEIKTELKTELKKDKNYLKLTERLEKTKEYEKLPKEYREELENWKDKIKSMTPLQWQNFIRNYDKNGLNDIAYGELRKTVNSASDKSQNMWVEKNIAQITNDFSSDLEKSKKEYDECLAKKPEILKKPKISFLYVFRTDDGKTFHDYESYEKHQQKLIDDWNGTRTVAESHYSVAQKELADCKQKKYNDVRIAIERHHPKLFEKMAEEAKKIYETSPVFYPVRAMVTVFQHYKKNKDIELEEWNKQSRQQTRTIDNDIGFSRD